MDKRQILSFFEEFLTEIPFVREFEISVRRSAQGHFPLVLGRREWLINCLPAPYKKKLGSLFVGSSEKVMYTLRTGTVNSF